MDPNQPQPIYQNTPPEMNSPLATLKKYWIYIVLLVIVFAIIATVILLSFTKKPTAPLPNETELPTPTPFAITPTVTLVQRPFKVLSTTPSNNQTGVFAGELVISLNTDNPLVASDSFNLDFNPPVAGDLRYLTKFPSQSTQVQILNGLQPSTTYQVTLTNSAKEKIYSWSFTTSNNRGEGESALSSDLDQQISQKYYPLSKYMPYSTSTYSLGYVDHLQLKITLKDSSADRTTVLNDVKAWVKSKGVDPESHTYIFAE